VEKLEVFLLATLISKFFVRLIKAYLDVPLACISGDIYINIMIKLQAFLASMYSGQMVFA